MGEGIKLPESERPSFESIHKRLDQMVSRKIQNIFVVDIQNDCTCSTEIYDADGFDNTVCYTSPEGLKENKWSSRLPLPMKNDLSEQEILNLLELACKYASDSCYDLVYRRMLYNPKSDVKKLYEIFEKYCHPVNINRSGDIMGWIPAAFVPEDCVYLIPDPEFFGALSVNIDKFGVFCIGNNVIRKSL